MKVLVTGSEGYIGKRMMPHLIELGYDAAGFDSNYFDGCDLGEPFSDYPLIEKDIRKIEVSDLEGIDAIIHLAALSNDPMGDFNPMLTREINLDGTIRLAKLAKKAKVKKFLFSSSCSVYGAAENGEVNENSQLNPQTEYARCKIEAEEELKKLADKNFHVGLLRNATVYGYSPRLRFDLVVNNFAGFGFSTRRIQINSDGMPWRPLIHIDDFCKTFQAVLEESEPEKYSGIPVNNGSDAQNYRVKEIAQMVSKQIPGSEIAILGEGSKDSRSYKVSFALLKKTFPNLKFNHTVESGAAQLVKKFHEVRLGLADFKSEKFTRLSHLNKLISDKKLDEKFYRVGI